jgi:hypothetical protein
LVPELWRLAACTRKAARQLAQALRHLHGVGSPQTDSTANGG